MAEGVNEKAITTSNPLGEEMLVEVAMPKSFKIKMVEASKLTDFKIWSAIFSLLTNIFVGFFVASITNSVQEQQCLLWWITVVFAGLALGALGMTAWTNNKMETQETKINLKASR